MNTKKTLLGLVLAALLAGCTSPPKDGVLTRLTSTTRPAATSVAAGIDWDWDAEGDNAVRPSKPFSIHGKTYLPMRQDQLMPAIFVAGQVVPFDYSPPYLVVQGEPPKIDLIAHGYRAVITKRLPPPPPATHTGGATIERENRVIRITPSTPAAQ